MPEQQLTAIIEHEDDGYVALYLELDNASQGVTIEGARDYLRAAIELFFETAASEEIRQRLHAARAGRATDHAPQCCTKPRKHHPMCAGVGARGARPVAAIFRRSLGPNRGPGLEARTVGLQPSLATAFRSISHTIRRRDTRSLFGPAAL
jgi:predicted RNase H-like HicB family nuclease